jgi:uncharacterized membrane protein
MRRWVLAALAGAAVVHVVAVWAIPRAIMRYTISRIADLGGRNVPTFAPRADETARAIVRPSPDLLYSICVFDVADGPVRVTAEVPRDTYWSVSMFADNTDNFFVLNDRQATDGRVDLMIASPGAAVDVPPGTTRVDTPSARGLVLSRTLVADEARLEELDASRRRFTCTPSAPR